MKQLLFLCIAALIITASQGQTNSETVTIGTQVWMKENLDITTFRNGDAIPEAKTDLEWRQAGKNKMPAWCYYDNKTENGKTYGKLYNWYALKDPRGLAPQGYHLPSDSEWQVITKYLGGDDVAGEKMKSTVGWQKSVNATNASGFAALPGGYRYYDGTFYDFGSSGNWWSSSKVKKRGTTAWFRNINNSSGDINRRNTNKQSGFSVRCIRD